MTPPITLMPTEAGAARLTGGLVSPHLFAMLGAGARLGRTLDAADAAAGSNVVVISTGAWQRYFQGNPGILGRTITLKTLGPEAGFLDGTPLTIVGVMPASFDYPLPNMDYWAPITNGSPAQRWAETSSRACRPAPPSPRPQTRPTPSAKACGRSPPRVPCRDHCRRVSAASWSKPSRNKSSPAAARRCA